MRIGFQSMNINLLLLLQMGTLSPISIDFIIIHSGERYISFSDPKINGNYLEQKQISLSVPRHWKQKHQRLKTRTVCRDENQPPLFPIFSDHSAEAILHYAVLVTSLATKCISRLANNAISKSTQCATSKNCKAVNCPFESFPESYGIDCIPIHQLNLLNGITDNNLLPDFNTKNTYCFNFGFEGDGNTSAINGRNFLFAPLQLSQNGIPNKCILMHRHNECDNMKVSYSKLLMHSCP